MTEGIQGERFSINYIAHPELLPDSKRMRRRLALLFIGNCDGAALRSVINTELGVGLPSGGCATESYWPRAMLDIELRDVLDTVTLVYKRVEERSRNSAAGGDFLGEVARIFREERVRYSVDRKGGVHLSVDTAFESARVSAVSKLSATRYNGVRVSLEAAYIALDQVPPDGKIAIRQTFSAAEALFRLTFESAHQLGTGEIEKHLKPAVDRKYSGQQIGISAVHKQVKQFQAWVEGAHFYRHEAGTEEPVQPPLEVAIHYVTAGTAWLRWLQGFDTLKS